MTEALPHDDLERMLRRALRPVEPPAELADALEATLESLTLLAADELESWELGAMRDPRNWLRPAAAVVVGTGAGAALVLLRARRRARAQPRRHGALGAADAVERALRDAILSAQRRAR